MVVLSTNRIDNLLKISKILMDNNHRRYAKDIVYLWHLLRKVKQNDGKGKK